MDTTRMPSCYLAPLGVPLYWHDERSGELGAAIKAYLDNRIDKTPLTSQQVKLVADYLDYFVHAPCWKWDSDDSLELLRASVKGLDSSDAIHAWLHRALDIGLDPL